MGEVEGNSEEEGVGAGGRMDKGQFTITNTYYTNYSIIHKRPKGAAVNSHTSTFPTTVVSQDGERMNDNVEQLPAP